MLKPQLIPPVPQMTARAAHTAFPKGHRYLTLRDELGTIFTDEMFADLFPKVGQPAAAPWRLALVLIVQHAEGLSDREVADAVRDRITLRYLLGLEYDDPGFDFSILSRFRDRLIEGNAKRFEEEPFRRKRKQTAGFNSRIGEDGFLLMNAVSSCDAPERLGDLAAVELLRRCWLEHHGCGRDEAAGFGQCAVEPYPASDGSR